MSHPEFGKWVDQVGPRDRVADVVRRALGQRLAAIRHYLPLAAERASEDIEFVHQLRVSTRRGMAALDVYEDLLPKHRSRWMKRQLRRVRRAAGQARDCDVLLRRLTAPSPSGPDDGSPDDKSLGGEGSELLVRRVREARSAAQQPIRDLLALLAQPHGYEVRVRQLLERIREHPRHWPGQGAVRFDRWGRRRLRPFVRQFFQAASLQTNDLAALHQFRIRGKQLRYAMELLAAAFPEEFRSELYPIVEQLQEHLGSINDHAVSIHRLQHWLAAAEQREEIVRIAILLQRDSQQLDQRLEVFRQWWTPARAEALQAAFRRMVRSPSSASK